MTYILDENRNKVFLDRYAMKDESGTPVETHVEQMWSRVAKEIASVEKEEDREAVEKSFYSILDDFKFVPGGRILAGAGTGNDVTYYNCFVIPSPKDSYEGIFENILEMGKIMRRGGGVGVDLSSLRPSGTFVKGTGGYSSGPVAFAQIYSETTLSTSQGGSRRGALMLMLADDHPDIMQFITEKQTPGRITGANISVKVSDALMEAVKEDKSWDLKWGGVVYKTMRARDLFNEIVKSAKNSAEPGLWFSERSNKMNNLYYLPEMHLAATNPCGEQPLQPWGVCNLGAVNLSKFVKKGKNSSDNAVDWEGLESTVRIAVNFLDNVVDATHYFNEENEKSQKDIRRIGLGSMGLADMLLKLGIRYGSPEAVTFTENLFNKISHWAYDQSVNLSVSKGCFPKFDADKFLEGEFIQRFSTRLRSSIKKYGLRNAYLLTQAPTGSTGLLSGVAGTGIEPVFAFTFRRTDRLGERIIKLPILDELGIQEDPSTWPSYVVTANDLTPKEHIDMQSVIQYWNDSAISKTANMPKGTTDEDVSNLYLYAYSKGLKGITVYVDGSREGVIHHIESEAPPVEKKETVFTKRPRQLPAVVYKQLTPLGKAYVTVVESEGEVAEVHVDLGGQGSDVSAVAKGLGLALTLSFNPRLQSLTNKEKVNWIVKQYTKITGSTTIGFGKLKVTSVPHAIAIVLKEHLSGLPQKEDSVGEDKPVQYTPPLGNVDLCPECGQHTFVRQDGCQTCSSCGYSKC